MLIVLLAVINLTTKFVFYMEIASIIAASKELIDYFSDFIYNYNKLFLSTKDSDTAYFKIKDGDSHEIYYHFLLEDSIHELEINYSITEKQKIVAALGVDCPYILNISFRRKEFFYEMVSDFNKYLAEINIQYLFIVGDPDGNLFVVNELISMRYL